MQTETIVIGGGISGLSAARRLHEAGRKFLLVTDRLGGRMHHSHDGLMNFGAVYITEDYKHVSHFVGRRQELRISQIYTKNGSSLMPFIHWTNLRFALPGLRLYRILFRFRKEINAFRKEAEFIPQHELLPRYPFLQEMVSAPATQFVSKYALAYLNEHFGRHALGATCFARDDEVNALFYLTVLLPLVVKTYFADFSSTCKKLTENIQHAIIYDKIKTLQKTGETSFTAATVSGKLLKGRNVIIAVPYHNAQLFYDVPKPHLSKAATVAYVRGTLRDAHRRKMVIMMDPATSPVVLIWRLAENMDIVVSLTPAPPLREYYSGYEVLAHVTWKEAMVVSGGSWVPMKIENNLFLAGDYNLCGLEDSYISGRCAANQIINC